ncbi:hypothetical protein, conserved [Babesia bigemina]|uniref:MMS19 nucleotide excision repair protein n=1 Tax=Babesia bigemina TaxID=5866 RepID=A0A061D096_BABBI|nr:hypothetical protein, conserved [Babesia bigemina]CDR94251.1 hypothetical protein, conserved [Babesia bigemina]|eukprot:XP_012766437.1 hypothetical protein, conserved [Babesia bigemina]
MSDSNSEDAVAEPRSKLIEWIDQYTSNDSETRCCDLRNHILVAVVNSKHLAFVQIVVRTYDHVCFYINTTNVHQENDPVRKRNICRLLYDVISRTENLFSAECLVPFLQKCLTVTVCTNFAILAIRALLERHIKIEGGTIHVLNILQPLYDALVAQNIASMAQQPRMDFLWITHFMLQLHRSKNLNLRQNFVASFCSAVLGEKDPRNLLVLFDLVAKLCEDDLADHDVDLLAKLCTPYYPIQFQPPKNDRIGITPLELKQRLLRVFKACSKFGPHAMEVLFDCLYSGYATEDDHAVILGDTLWFIKECAPIYGVPCYSYNLESFIDVLVSEFFTDAASRKNGNDECLDDTPGGIIVDGVLSDLESSVFSVTEANKLGMLYYEGWKYVSNQLKIFGDIVKVYMDVVDVYMCKEVVIKLLRTLKNNFTADNSKIADANGYAAYFLDILCGMPKYHDLLLEYVFVPLCNDIIVMFAQFKKGLDSEDSLCKQLALMLPVVTNTLFAKLVSYCVQPIPTIYAKQIVVGALCSLQLNDNTICSRGLKLLTLAISSSTCPVLEHVLIHCLKESQLFSKKRVCRDGMDIRLYADALLAMLKSHYVHCDPIVEQIRLMMDCLVVSSDIEDCILAYFSNDVDLSHEMAEICAIVLNKSTDKALVKQIFAAYCKCFIHVCENPESKIGHATFVFSLAITANRKTLCALLNEEFSFNQLLGYYKVLSEKAEDRKMSQSVLKLATFIIPQYMSMTLDHPSADIARQLCEDGLIFLLPLLFNHISNEIVAVIIEHAKRDQIKIMELESIGWLLKCWVKQDCNKSEALNFSFESSGDYFDNQNRMEVSRSAINLEEISNSRFSSLLSEGLPSIILSYLLEDASYQTLVSRDMKSHMLSLPPSVISATVARMYPFQVENMSATLEYLGYNPATFIGPSITYSDVFFVDGTEVELVPPLTRMQHKILMANFRNSRTPDASVAKYLINVLSESKDNLAYAVAITSVALRLEHSELLYDNAEIMQFVMQQYVSQWPKLDAVKNKRAAVQRAAVVDDSIQTNLHSPYEKWLQREFLFLSQCLLLKVICLLEQSSSSGSEVRHSFDYLWSQKSREAVNLANRCEFEPSYSQWEQLTEVAASVALESSLPVCRVFGILLVHCIVKAAPKTISASNCRSVMKRMSECLGDGCQRARAVAIKCRHNWLQK